MAAAILYVPANLLPIMHTESILGAEDDTILTGVIMLINTGSWPLALLVFVASIFVPILKLLAVGFLVYTTWRGSVWAPLQRTRLYRVVEAVGRWSMLDIFVITVLVSLVQFQTLARITPGSGALAFASVVVLTMVAAQSLDPRLMWEHVGDSRG
jgi:paraquat-inducible protein A